MTEEQLKLAALKLALQIQEVEPLALANMAKPFGVHQETFAEALLCYEKETTGNQGFITESTYQMLESTIKFTALLRHREGLRKLVDRAQMLVAQKNADSAEEAVEYAASEEHTPKMRREAIAILKDGMSQR